MKNNCFDWRWIIIDGVTYENVRHALNYQYFFTPPKNMKIGKSYLFRFLIIQNYYAFRSTMILGYQYSKYSIISSKVITGKTVMQIYSRTSRPQTSQFLCLTIFFFDYNYIINQTFDRDNIYEKSYFFCLFYYPEKAHELKRIPVRHVFPYVTYL